MIHLRLPERRSTRLTPPAPVPTVDKADEMILQDTLQISLAEHISREEQEARENVALVDEHLASEEIEKMVDGQENIVDDSLIPRNDESNIPGTRIEPRSDKESPEVEIAKETEVEISKEKEVEQTNVVILVNVNDEDEEITNEVYELKRREKGKIVEETRNSPIPTPIRSPRIHTNLVSLDTEKLQELTDTPHTTSSTSLPQKKTLWLLVCTSEGEEQVVKQVPEQVQNQVPVYVAEGLILERQKAKEVTGRLISKAILQEFDASVRSYMSGHILHVHPAQSQKSYVPKQQYQLTPAVRPRDQDNPHDDAYPEGENSAKRQKTSEYEAYVSRESSSEQTDSYASDDDEIPSKQVSQEIMEEVSLTIDELKLRKMADEMLRQRCTSGNEHQYHIDQMKNLLKSDIVWESRKEILVSSHPRKTKPLVQSCQRDPEAPALSLINQDLLYLKKGNSGPEKIVLLLHKFPAIIFNDDDIKENPHAKIFYIMKQKEPGKPKEEIYSNSKMVQVIKTYWEFCHEHKFLTETVARRANDCIVSITDPDYKNLNKNDIKDIYLLFYQQKVNLTAPTMTFPGIEDHEMFSIIYEPVHGIIYKNSKKEKRVMRHSEIHKFCDAMLNRVLEGLKSYNNDVKYGYIQKDLTKYETEYLKLFEEEIEERLKHRRQMRRWEMYVNGRPLGPRRERPE
ncbi:hypothetical protein Tco_1301279 [Tanacetum coccineum]